MESLKAALIAFLRKQSDLAPVEECLAALLSSSPEKSKQALALIKKASDVGLPADVFERLNRRIEAAKRAIDEAEQTFTETVVLPSSPRVTGDRPVEPTPPSPPPAPASSPTATFTETVVLPTSPRITKEVAQDTLLETGDPLANDSDATVLDTVTRGTEPTQTESRDKPATLIDDDVTTFSTETPASTPPPRMDADATLAHTMVEDATTLNPGVEVDDSTQLSPSIGSGGERTVADTSLDATQAGDFDVLAAGGGSTSTTRPPRGAGAPDGEFREGSILRQRFELMSKLGEGGMGAVWKGKDMLKVEARDRNPFVAIKLLQGDFKEHPEAFIALQRETSKQQRLAHPNIATVYDFDRDMDTDTVFMTMEVLDGQDLASFVRKLPADGLPLEEAMPYIEQLGDGLAYAHEAELVHSDLKPGNCFLTNEGRIKLLDFGIARASKTKADASGEQTVFDPGDLGALTPTYATVEMFDGEDPDPRDDIYALAIMSYQLLTGKHPYGKQSAPKAMEQKLSPAPVDKINKRQNRALQRGLEFLRDNRTPSVEDFLEDLRPKKSYFWQISAAAVVVLALIGGLAYGPIKQYFLEQRMEEVVAVIEAAGNEAQYVEAVELVDASFADAPDARKAIYEDERVKTRLIVYFGGLADAATAPSNEFADYAEAERLLAVVRDWYKDSAAVLTRINEIDRKKEGELSLLNTQYNRLLDDGVLIPSEDTEDIGDVLTRVTQIDAEHEILKDKELPIRYADLVEAAINENNYAHANQLLIASVAYAPDDPQLNNLRYDVEKELKRQRDAIEVAEIQSRLENQVKSFTSLADFQKVRADLVRLADLDPTNEVLVSMQKTLKDAFGSELSNAISTQTWDTGEELLVSFAQLLDIPFLLRNRALLSNAESAAGYEITMSDTHKAAIEDRQRRINALLGDPKFTDEWEIDLQVPYKELIALLPANSPQLIPLRDRTAELYLAKAQESRGASRFGQAIALVENGENFYPSLSAFADERVAIADAQVALKKLQAEERRLARVKKLKGQILADAKADKPQDAVQKLAEVRKELATDDPFLLEQAPPAIAGAYQRLALQQAEQGSWENAARFARAAFDLAPDLDGLAEELAGYDGEVKKIAGIIDLKKQLAGKGKVDFDKVKKQLAEIKSSFPDKWDGLRREYNQLVKKRLAAIESSDVAAAHAFRNAAATAFPAIAKVKLKPLPSKLAARGLKEVNEGRLSAARATLDEAVAKDGTDHPDIGPFKQALNDRIGKAQQYFKEAEKFKKKKQPRKAKQYLVDGAMKLWTDNPEYEKSLAELSASGSTGSSRKGEYTVDKAGHGTRSRGTCYDEVGQSTKGPVMVVVPAGGGISKPFAIGKFEVSISEFNAYCKLSGKCAGKSGDGKLPVTGISLQAAQAYASWLSGQSGAKYRLPTEVEWEYAAKAGGKQPKKDFNCRVQLGEQLLKGHSLVNAKSGQQNGWGLANYIGNAQEWVKTGGGVKARGGTFEEPLSKCEISLTKAHSGGADPLTGFRLVRELG